MILSPQPVRVVGAVAAIVDRDSEEKIGRVRVRRRKKLENLGFSQDDNSA
jgi:hypothetical protein